MNREQAQDFVKDQLEAYLQRKGIDTGEPFNCLNPDHRDENPSMIYDRALRKVHCFGCHAKYDIFDLIGIDYHLTTPIEILNKAYELYRIKLQKLEMERPGFKLVTTKADESGQDYTDYIKEAHQRVGETDYFRKRGLSQTVIERFSLGYEPDFTTRDSTGMRTWRAGIIPTSRFTYTVRNMDPQAQPTERIRKRGGTSPIFNPQALHSGQPVFIVEGEMDALSLVEVGAEATALASPSNIEPFIEYIKKNPPAGGLILSLDNDTTGEETARQLAQELRGLDIPFTQVNVSDPYNDPNEALTSNRDAFAQAVRDAQRALDAWAAEEEQNEQEEYQRTCAAYYVQEFQPGSSDWAAASCFPTGLPRLDLGLGGGLYEGLYILAGEGASGKTALLTQIADNLAADGHEVLIFSLQTPRRELMARSLSRLTYLGSGPDPSLAKTARDLTTACRYQDYSQAERTLIAASLESYRGWAERIYISEGRGETGAEQLRAILTQHLRHTGHKPVVMVDCLQLLASPMPGASDGCCLTRNTLELKRLSRDYRLPVWAMAGLPPAAVNRRRDYHSPIPGVLHYSADVILGLQVRQRGEGNELAIDAARPGMARRSEVKILKNRHGESGLCLAYDFYPHFGYFAEVEG